MTTKNFYDGENNKVNDYYYIQLERDDDGELGIRKNPYIEEITKEDIKELLLEVLKTKPKQVGIGQFNVRHCDKCAEDYVLHLKQTFCPICKMVIEIIDKDANSEFHDLFAIWQEEKNFLERILYGSEDAALYILDDIQEGSTIVEELE